MPKLDKMFSNIKDLARMAAEHRPENPGDYLNLGAGLSSVLGRAHDAAKVNVGGPNAPGYSQRFYNAAKSLLSGELGMTPGVALHELPQELMTAYETALEAKKGINPSQRLLKGLAGVTGTTPAAYEAKQKAMTEALAAERSAADARRNLLLAGVGGAGLLGAAALMGRRAEDPDTYKHSSELGWQPRGLLRQKVAAPADPFGDLDQGIAAANRLGATGIRLYGGGPGALSADQIVQAVRGNAQPPTAPAMRMPLQPRAAAPAVDPLGMFGSQAGQSVDALSMERRFPSSLVERPRAAAPAANPFENVALPPAPALRLPEMQRGGTPRAAPASGGMMGPPRPRFLGVSDADAIAAARNAAQYGNFGGARLAAGSREGQRQFTAAQARAFLERNPMAAQRSLGEVRQGFQSQAPAPAAAPRVDAGLYRTLGQSRMPAAPAPARAPGSMNMSLGQSRMPAPTRIPAGPVSRPQIPQSVATGQQAYTQPATARMGSGYSIPGSYTLLPRQDVASSLVNAFK